MIVPSFTNTSASRSNEKWSDATTETKNFQDTFSRKRSLVYENSIVPFRFVFSRKIVQFFILPEMIPVCFETSARTL